MSSTEILKHFEENANALQKLLYLMKWGDDLSCRELAADIGADSFRGHAYLLPMVLLTSSDPAIERARDRLFLKWFRKELEACGESGAMAALAAVLDEERQSLAAQKEQNNWRR